MTHTLTVAELIKILRTYPSDAIPVLTNDGGYNPWLSVDLNPDDPQAPVYDVFNNEPEGLGGPYRYNPFTV